MTGYRCIQVGTWGFDRCLLEGAGTLCHWRLGLGDDANVPDIRFDGLHLPVASGSVDALVLAHGLEQVPEPHILLRECARVLNERGQLIVMIFNPFSWWALRQIWPSRHTPRFRPCSAPPSASRLCDWLRLLEFEPEQLWRYGLGFPMFGRTYQVGRGMRWPGPLAWSAQAYAVVARRHVAPRTRLRDRPRQRRAMPAASLALLAGGRVPYRSERGY